MTTSRLLRNAVSPGWESPRDILLEDGRIKTVGEKLEAPENGAIDLAGRVVIPGLVDGHTHLDKALSLDLCENPEGTLLGAIQAMGEFKQSTTVEEIYGRAERCLQMFISHGATTVRTHVDVDPTSGLRGMEALVRLREAHRDKVNLQVIAFASGISGPLGQGAGRERFEAAIDMGADVVGGSPTLSQDPNEHIDAAFEMAMARDLPVDMHIDESDNPDDQCLEILAEKTLAEGYQGRVVAGHCCSLAAMDDATAGRIIEKVSKAGVSVITMPFCNLYLQGRQDTQPIRRGVTRVKELEEAGVNVYCASDNVQDPFGPYGRADTLEAAMLTALAAQWNPNEVSKLLDMVTTRPAQAVGLGEPYGVQAGSRADLLVLDSTRPDTVIMDRPARLLVLQAGRIVSATPGAADLGVSGSEAS